MSKMKDEELITLVKESLDYLDSNVSVNVPNLTQIKMLIEETEKRKKKRLVEFCSFLLCAALVLLLTTAIYMNFVVAFIVVQGVMFVAIPFSALIWFKKAGRQVNIL